MHLDVEDLPALFSHAFSVLGSPYFQLYAAFALASSTLSLSLFLHVGEAVLVCECLGLQDVDVR